MSLDNYIEVIAKSILREAARSMLSLDANKDSKCMLAMREAAEMDGDPAENFDGWLPLSLAGSNRYYNYSLQELNVLVNTCRKMVDTNEVAKNIQLHHRNFIVGKHITIDIVATDGTDDSLIVAKAKGDSTITKMLENWKLFVQANKFDARCRNWVTRAHKDGECIQRIFPGLNGVPSIRFIEPLFIKSPSSEVPYGIKFVKDDAETPETFYYQPEGKTDFEKIPALEIIYDQRNVDMGAPRGIPSYWPCLSNIRRLEKVLVNSSVLTAVQAAITMVRKHTSSTAAKVQALVARQSDGINRVDPNSGRNVVGRRFRPGTILDAPQNVDYEFPSHSIDASSFVKIAEHELAHIAANFSLPVSWLMAAEPTEPLTPGSPTIAYFETEQEVLFEGIETIFWTVQGMMGVNVEATMPKYDLLFNGKRLAVGKALDEARVDEILQRVGAQSPQTTASKHGNTWSQERAGTIRHRATAQPGEAMPGDAGNTDTSGKSADGKTQDGVTKKKGGARDADAGGGNNAA